MNVRIATAQGGSVRKRILISDFSEGKWKVNLDRRKSLHRAQGWGSCVVAGWDVS